MSAISKSSGETARMHRLAWAFADCLCDYPFLICWLHYIVTALEAVKFGLYKTSLGTSVWCWYSYMFYSFIFNPIMVSNLASLFGCTPEGPASFYDGSGLNILK